MASDIRTSLGVVEAAPQSGPGIGQQIVVFAEVLLLGLWLGSMIFFSFAVAPSAFAVLPTRELAGVMVTSTIGKVELLGLIIGTVLILLQAARRSVGHSTIKMVQSALTALMIGCAALSRFWISPTMVSLRAEMRGHIDDVPATDPMRVQFNDLHQYSVGLMVAALLAGFVVLFITVRSCLKR